MRRRVFITGAAAAAGAWPAIGRGQDRARRVGILMNGTDKQPVPHQNLATFMKSLAAAGWMEGRNLRVDLRWAGEDSSGLQPAASELVALAPDVMLAVTSPAAAALHKRTDKIPIVFVVVTDPVGQGFVPNLARPGGNMTGFSNYDAPMAGKWLGLLKEVAPGISRVGLHVNPDTAPYFGLLERSLVDAGQAVGVSVATAFARNDEEIDRAFAKLAETPGSGMVVAPDSFTVSHGDVVVAAAARHRVPTVYPYQQFVQRGGLIAYGCGLVNLFVRAADYVDRILKGADPAGLPVQAPAQFEMAVNLGTAKALGLTVPQSLLHLADVVIE